MSPAIQPLGMVVAVARDGVIGQTGGHLGLPWHIPEDLRHFKALTTGHAILMGRRTHEAIGRALPKRRNIVLTRSGRTFEGCETFGSLEDAIAAARSEGDAMPMIIGGASVYRQALPLTTVVHLTRVERAVEGDATFPMDALEGFEEVERRVGETPDVTFLTLRRR